MNAKTDAGGDGQLRGRVPLFPLVHCGRQGPERLGPTWPCTHNGQQPVLRPEAERARAQATHWVSWLVTLPLWVRDGEGVTRGGVNMGESTDKSGVSGRGKSDSVTSEFPCRANEIGECLNWSQCHYMSAHLPGSQLDGTDPAVC